MCSGLDAIPALDRQTELIRKYRILQEQHADARRQTLCGVCSFSAVFQWEGVPPSSSSSSLTCTINALTFDTLAATFQRLDVHVNAALASPLVFRQVTVQVNTRKPNQLPNTGDDVVNDVLNISWKPWLVGKRLPVNDLGASMGAL